MRSFSFYCLFFLIAVIIGCKQRTKPETSTSFFTAKEAIRFNQLIYKDTTESAFVKYSPDTEPVFIPQAIDGNYAIIAKSKTENKYAIVVRGSVMAFSNEGFQNFILQDFNIFKIKSWPYADTVKEAYISNGAWIGFQNLLKLTDIKTNLSIKEFIEQKIPIGSSIVVTGHSLGGNLAYPLAGYLKKELSASKKSRLQLITFGAPAAGNAAFVQDMEDKFPDAERYVTAKDIAPTFPDLEQIEKLASNLGLDKVLEKGKLNINGLDTEINSGTLLNIANEILEKTNVINKTNKYVQSQKHLRLLEIADKSADSTPLSVEALFGKAYQFHRVDMYAELLGGEALK